MYKTLDDVLSPMRVQQPQSRDINLPYAPVATERVAVIVNKNAKQVDDAVAKRLAGLIPQADFFYSHTLEDAEAFARQVVQRGYGTVMCGGGDGTLVNIVNHVFRYVDEANEWRMQRARHFGETQPLLPYPEFGILKLGTGNGLAAVVGAKQATLDLQTMLSGERHPTINLDLIESEGSKFFFAGMGYDARVLNDYIAVKKWAAKSSILKKIAGSVAGYLMAALSRTVPHMLRHGFNAQVKVINTGKDGWFLDPRRGDRAIPIKEGQVVYEGPAGLVGVGTAPYYGFGFKIYPFAGIRPGYMNLRLATCAPLKALAHLPGLWRGTWRDPEVLDFLVSSVRIESKDPLPFQHSGDGQGQRTSVEFKIADRPLKLVDYSGPAL
jgi:diacylglycerol kinase family enzyme